MLHTRYKVLMDVLRLVTTTHGVLRSAFSLNTTVSIEPCGTGRLNPSRETRFSGAHGDLGVLIFPVLLTTSRIGNLTQSIYTLLYVMTIHT